ncbi:MAG: hypothetical protein ACRDT4_21675, partial [Micromonosporaceae bacterium]
MSGLTRRPGLTRRSGLPWYAGLAWHTTVTWRWTGAGLTGRSGWALRVARWRVALGLLVVGRGPLLRRLARRGAGRWGLWRAVQAAALSLRGRLSWRWAGGGCPGCGRRHRLRSLLRGALLRVALRRPAPPRWRPAGLRRLGRPLACLGGGAGLPGVSLAETGRATRTRVP